MGVRGGKVKNRTLFCDVTVIDIQQEQPVLNHRYVGVSDGKIAYIGEEKPEEFRDARSVDGKNKVLMSGLINSHTHIPMTALRGYSDDTDLQDWLYNKIFPIEDKFTKDTIRIATQLGVMEAMSFGTTSLSDMYFFSDEIASVCAQSKIKANISRGAHLFTEEFDPTAHQAMVEQNELLQKWNGYDQGLILIDCAIHGEYTTNYKMWEYVRDLAASWNTRIQIHLSETQKEHEECIQRYGMTPTAVLHRHGFFDPSVVAAHCVYITEEDMDILKEKNVTAALCPVSNLKLASGRADGNKMLQKGINLSLGTDGVASNNNADLFEEIKLTAMLQKERAKDPTCFEAQEVLQMATRGGAIAQGRQKETGTMAVGMDADLILLDFDKPHLYPCHNVLNNLVYSAKGSDVCMTMVRGQVVYENGEFKTLDREKIIYETNKILMPTLFGTSHL